MEENMKKKHVSLLLAAAMAASVISGCGNSANNSAAETEKTETTAAAATSAAEETTAAEAAEDTEKNETDEVVIATPRDAVQGSGDAYYCWEGAYVWEALTANNGGVIDPWLAKSWEHTMTVPSGHSTCGMTRILQTVSSLMLMYA